MVTQKKHTARLNTWFSWSKNKRHTQTETELPNRSPELAVTKTQLSLGRKRKMRI